VIARLSDSSRFRIRRTLGEGSTGIVFEAEDSLTDAIVALKVLRVAESEAIYRFKREFRALASLPPHPNLVRLGELFCEKGEWFFTMELVNGTPLSRYVRPEAVDEHRLREAFRQLADGLGVLHAAGQVHRDVKPSNVLVTADGRVVLLDFGLTTDRVGAMNEATVMGTAAYMAPEQVRPERIGSAVDCYAVGVLLFEALTGTLPFDGEPLAIMRAKEERAAPAPSAVVAGVLPDLDQLCAELLARDPAARPSALDLGRRLGGESSPLPRAERAEDEAVAPPSFVGRAEELARLSRAFEDVRRTGATTVLVEGEAGIGKTALVEHFLSQLCARDPSVVALSGRCYERERVPFKALDGVVDAMTQYLRRIPPVEAASLLPAGIHFLATLFPIVRRVPVVARAVPPRRGIDDPMTLRARAFDGLVELFASIAHRAPLVIFMDDLQWIDDDSLQFLEKLLGPPGVAHGMLVGTMRPALGAASARTARLRSLFAPMNLPALAPAESSALLEALSPRGLSPQEIESLVNDSGGHPLLLAELAGGVGSTHVRLEELMGRRFAQLDPIDQRLLEVLAVAGVPLSRSALARATGLAPAECIARFGKLREQRLLRTVETGSEPRIAIFHDRVREALDARLGSDHPGAEGGAAIHLALGRALLEEATGDALDGSALFAVTDHLQSGATLIASRDERRRLLALSLRAARQARLSTAYDTALEYVERAKPLLSADDVRERFLLAKATIELDYLRGETARALERFRDAVSAAKTDAERCELYVLLIEMHTACGQFADAVDAARKGLKLFGVSLPTKPGTPAILRELAVLRFHQGRRSLAELAEMPESRDERTQSAVELLMSVGPAAYFSDALLLSVVLLKIASLSLRNGATPHSGFGFVGYGMIMSGAFAKYQAAFELGELGIKLDQRFGTGEAEAKIQMMSGAFLTPWVRRPYADAFAQLRRAEEAGLRVGDIAYRNYAAIAQSLLEELAGGVDDVLRAATSGLEIARRSQDKDQIATNDILLLTYGKLQSSSGDPFDLSKPGRNEDELKSSLSDAQTPMAMGSYFFCKALLAYHFGAFEAAWRHLLEAEAREGPFFAGPALPTRALYKVLIGAELASSGASPIPRRTAVHAVGGGLAKIRKWARSSPEKFSAMLHLAEAEFARASSREAKADAARESAIKSARDEGARRVEAIARELAARVASFHGDHAKAQSYDPAGAYERWGAHGKAIHLQSRKPSGS
jgi:predicted ATPase